MAKTFDLNRGDTGVFGIPLKQRNKKDPVDLTGGTLTMTINLTKAPADNTSAIFTKTKTEFTEPDDDPINGIGTIKIDNSDSQNWTPATYWYDFQFIDSGGEFTSSGVGKFIVGPDVSRNTS